MGLFGDVVKGAISQATSQMSSISKEKARSMSDNELSRMLDRLDDVPSPMAREAILDEARRRGMR